MQRKLPQVGSKEPDSSHLLNQMMLTDIQRRRLPLKFHLKLGLVLILCLVASALPAGAQSSITGIYICTKVEVAGKINSCSAPSIELKSDGSYQILAERGNYEVVAGRWLVLSDSKNHGKARLDGGKGIVFEFRSNGKRSKITYRRKFQRAPGSVAV